MRKESNMKLRISETSNALKDNETFAALRSEPVIHLEEDGEWKPIDVLYNGKIVKILGNVPFGSLGEHFKDRDPQMALCIRLSSKTTLIQLPDDMLIDTINNHYKLQRKMYLADYPKSRMVNLFVYPAEKITQNAMGSMYHVTNGVKATEIMRILRKSSKMASYNMFLWDEKKSAVGPLINLSNKIIPDNREVENVIKHYSINTPISVILMVLPP